MAKFQILFKDFEDDYVIETYECGGIISVIITANSDSLCINLDKSTAIKFAKTLRTEINKITESEVSNG